MSIKQPSTPLPWHLMKEGFSTKSGKIPTVYATNSDLEYVCHFHKDNLLINREQDNLKNAEYAQQAVNNFPKAVELLSEMYYSLSSGNNPDLFETVGEFLSKLENNEKTGK